MHAILADEFDIALVPQIGKLQRMTRLMISVPDSLESSLHRRVAQAGFQSDEEYIVSLVQADCEAAAGRAWRKFYRPVSAVSVSPPTQSAAQRMCVPLRSDRVDPQAARLVDGADRHHRRVSASTGGVGTGTALGKRTAGWQIGQIGWRAADRFQA